MSQIIEVIVPDIGNFKDVPVIELLVKVGDTVKAEDALLTLESDKATIDIPSPADGVVKELKIGVGGLRHLHAMADLAQGVLVLRDLIGQGLVGL